MAEGTVPGLPPNTSNKVMVRNIITGVITTVVGGTTIYFLGFHNSGGSGDGGFLVTKDATMNTWKSYVSAENVFYKNFGTFGFENTKEGIDRYQNSITEELDRFNSAVKRILDTKNIDPTLSSLMVSRLVTNKNWVTKHKKYLDKYKEIIISSADQEEIKRRSNEALQAFQNDVKDINQRFINEIDDVCKTLTAKYSYTFSMTDLLIYKQQPNQNNNNTNTDNTYTGNNNNSGISSGGTMIDGKALVGKWSSGTNTLYQYEDGKMYYYYSNGDSTYGSWQLYNNQLYHYYSQYYGAGYRYVYNLSNITHNGFSIALVDSPFNRFDFIRAIQ